MSGTRDTIQRFRSSRPVNILASVIILGVGLYNIVIESGAGNLAIGLLFVVIGLFGLYNQFVGESVVDTLKSSLR